MSFDEPEPSPWVAMMRQVSPPAYDPAGCLRCGGIGYVEPLEGGGDRWLAPDGVREAAPFVDCPDCQTPPPEPEEPWIIGDGLR